MPNPSYNLPSSYFLLIRWHNRNKSLGEPCGNGEVKKGSIHMPLPQIDLVLGVAYRLAHTPPNLRDFDQCVRTNEPASE